MKSLTFNRGAAFARAFSAFCTLALVCAGAAGASPSGSDGFERKKVHLTTGSHTPAPASASGSIVRTIVGLAIVVAVIYGLYWIMKQSKGSKNAASGDGLEQVASLPMGAGKSLALVRVGGELHMLGLAEHQISPLRIFTEEEAYELGLPMEADKASSGTRDGQPPIQRFIDRVRRISGR